MTLPTTKAAIMGPSQNLPDRAKVGAAIRTRMTPKVAIELLDAHQALVDERGGGELNRNISDDLVAKYARDMLNGAWVVNGETIKIAKSGRLLDGQHRLWAAADHNATFDTYVVRDLDEEAFYTIDTGRTRKPSDFLTVDGIADAKVTAAAARIVMSYRAKNMREGKNIPSQEIVEFVKANMRIQAAATAARGCQKIVALSIAAAWHFLFSERDRDAAQRFIDDLREGVGLTKGDPVLALRERLISNKNSRAKLRQGDLFLLGIRIWNDRRQGKRRTVAPVREMKSTDGETILPKVI